MQPDKLSSKITFHGKMKELPSPPTSRAGSAAAPLLVPAVLVSWLPQLQSCAELIQLRLSLAPAPALTARLARSDGSGGGEDPAAAEREGGRRGRRARCRAGGGSEEGCRAGCTTGGEAAQEGGMRRATQGLRARPAGTRRARE